MEFTPDKFDAQTTTLNFKEINDSFELMESMNISAEVSVKTVGYKAEGKAKFAKDVKVSGFSSTFVIEAEVQNGAEFAAPTPKRPRGKAENRCGREGRRGGSPYSGGGQACPDRYRAL